MTDQAQRALVPPSGRSLSPSRLYFLWFAQGRNTPAAVWADRLRLEFWHDQFLAREHGLQLPDDSGAQQGRVTLNGSRAKKWRTGPRNVVSIS